MQRTVPKSMSMFHFLAVPLEVSNSGILPFLSIREQEVLHVALKYRFPHATKSIRRSYRYDSIDDRLDHNKRCSLNGVGVAFDRLALLLKEDKISFIPTLRKLRAV